MLQPVMISTISRFQRRADLELRKRCHRAIARDPRGHDDVRMRGAGVGGTEGAEAERLARTARTDAAIGEYPFVAAVEIGTLRAAPGDRTAIRRAALLPGTGGGQPHLDGPRHVDQRGRPKVLREVAPQPVDIRIAFGLRGRVGIAPDPDVVITKRVRAVLKELIRAVALRTDQRLKPSGERKKLAFLAVGDFQRDNGHHRLVSHASLRFRL